VCEDTQQETFIRRFLNKNGWSTRRIRVEKAPAGRGSGEQFVRRRFPIELNAYRKKAGQVNQAVVAMIDGDNHGVAARIKELEEACVEAQVEPRQLADRVAVFVPTWNIETWIAYLNGNSVDEAKADYPRLDKEKLCREHVNALSEMCGTGRLRAPAPPSLSKGCKEYNERLLGKTE
jgi:hypothetical protein